MNTYNMKHTPLDLLYGATNYIWDITNFNPMNKESNMFVDVRENTITSHTKFEIFNAEVYNRMIQLNKTQKDYLIEMRNANAPENGLSDNYSSEIVKPEEWDGYNYLDFAQTINSIENSGLNTTQVKLQVEDAKLSSLQNKINTYPKEVSSATNVTWNINDKKNSILYKTQQLFNENKINTIISRFGTNTENNGNNIQYNGQVATSYGESRGRNLLTKEAETSHTTYNINGYKNPYCRTWTNHYQYDNYTKTIRPFKSGETLKEVNTWNKSFTEQKTGGMEWGWRDNNSGYDKSVMSDGMINFAPVYKGGGEKNIHTRQCMFSIENLAWKDFNPYSFENCLSWEQRGPNGGRIMWFPPYGLTFNESTQARWQSHQFIGRGEEVYTYQDTVRSGTLTFLMVVDHPSIIDYVFGSHNKNNTTNNISKKNNLNDNDIHRYFAGCDQNTLKEAAAPTPLTDEYSGFIDFGVLALHDDLLIKGKENQPPQSTPKKVTFQWYFPNNYSGHYDNNTLEIDTSKVSSVKYTLMGTAGGIKRDMTVSKKKWDILPDSVLQTGVENEGFVDGYSTGYLMGLKTPDKLGDEYLLPQQTPRFLTKKAKGPMKNVANKGRFYRVDYDPSFTWPKNEDCYRNTLDQVCNGKHKVTNNYNFNVETPDKSANEDEKIYSFLFLSCALMEITGKQPELLTLMKTKYSSLINDDENGNYQQLVTLLRNIKDGVIQPKTIIANGYSSVQQATTDAGKKRNEYLAKQRATTIKTLFENSGIYNGNVTIEIKDFPSQGKNDKDENGEEETKYRRAELVIELETEKQETAATTKKGDNQEQTQQQKIDEYNEKHKYIGYTKTDTIVTIDGKRYYLYAEDGTDRLWFNIDDDIDKKPEIDPEELLRKEKEPTNWRLYNDEIIKSGKHAGIQVRERKEEKNNIRYDQEYYFFKKLETKDPIVFKSLIDKLQYFDPTFHSMTPEGFNGRLTFLQQCMRQGDTLTEIEHLDEKGETGHVVTAKNLAFGRPPFCILRIGDFYNQTIIIENLSINYDFDGGVRWDLNSEGIGVQPLLAQVQLSIKLIGGGDMSGPIRRLQNAMSFNYYANTSLYDNRADRYEYDINQKTAQKGELKKENCFVYDAFTKTDDVKMNRIKEKVEKQLEKDINFGKEVAPTTYAFNINSVDFSITDPNNHNLTYGDEKTGYSYYSYNNLKYKDSNSEKPKPKD